LKAILKPNILLIYTGGTIGMIKDADTGALKAFNFKKLIKGIPELKLLDCNIETVSFEKPIDSSNMQITDWQKMAAIIKENYTNFDGFVVLHGSDTMSYSASALSFMFENLDKPIVFTGSQLPIGDLRTDAKENLITAIQIASLQDKGKPVIQEVSLYFEYKLYRGNRTTKISAEHFNAFTSPNFPELVESGVHLNVNNVILLKQKTTKKLKVNTNFDDNVLILKLFPGINKTILHTLLHTPNLKGVVLETYGSGNAPMENWFISEIENAIERGLHIVNVTQCSGGSVLMGTYETSTRLKEIGLISGKNITTEAAITKLMYLLGQNVGSSVFKTIFETPLRGEMND
jgi:L-asparaginase